jgi:hypothetical protein
MKFDRFVAPKAMPMTPIAKGSPLHFGDPSMSSATSGAIMMAAMYPLDDSPALTNNAIIVDRRAEGALVSVIENTDTDFCLS